MEQIPFIDHPELKINKNESTQMPFRYVKGTDGRPIMPEVRARNVSPRVLSQILTLCIRVW